MATRTAKMEVLGIAYVGSGTDDDDPFWAEGVPSRLEVELTDTDEVRLGLQVGDSTTDDATFYLSRAEAARVALMIGKASLDEIPT